MADCDVCLSGATEYCELFFTRDQRARKPQRCEECGDAIPVGVVYKVIGGKYDGEFWREKACLLCFEINTVFSCNNGTMWGNFWEEMWDYVLPSLKVTSPCFNKLSMEARAKLTEKWWKWKELNADR